MKKLYSALGFLFFANTTAAGGPVVPLVVGTAPLGPGAPLPLEMGGIAAIAAVSLILGAQLIKRKK